MGIFDKFLDSMKLNDDDYDDDYEYDEEEFEDDEDIDDVEEIEEKPRKSFFNRSKKVEEEEEAEPAEEIEQPAKARAKAPAAAPTAANNVVPMRASGKGMEVCMIKPNNLNDGREIVDTLLSGCAVVINMEGIPTDTAQKIIDFTSGACYATKGNMQKISNYIFIATPVSINLSGDFQDMMGSGSSFAE